MFEEGKDRALEEVHEASAEVKKAIDEQLTEDEEDLEEFEANEGFTLPNDLERQRAKKAYDDVTARLRKRDLNSDTLFEDLLSEKAYELHRFVPKPVKKGGMKISHKDMSAKDLPPTGQMDPAQELLDLANVRLEGRQEADLEEAEGAEGPEQAAEKTATGRREPPDDAEIRRRIQKIMEEYATPRAKGGRTYNAHEQRGDGKPYDAPLEEPELRV